MINDDFSCKVPIIPMWIFLVKKTCNRNNARGHTPLASNSIRTINHNYRRIYGDTIYCLETCSATRNLPPFRTATLRFNPCKTRIKCEKASERERVPGGTKKGASLQSNSTAVHVPQCLHREYSSNDTPNIYMLCVFAVDDTPLSNRNEFIRNV